MSDQSRPHSSSEPAHIAEMRHEKYRLWYLIELSMQRHKTTPKQYIKISCIYVAEDF